MKIKALGFSILSTTLMMNSALAGNMGTTNTRSLWDGLYLGINGGGMFSSNNQLNIESNNIQYCTVCDAGESNSSASKTGAVSHLSMNNKSFSGGGQLGYNRNAGNHYVIGLETDFQGIANGNKTKSANSMVSFGDSIIGNEASQSIKTNFVGSKHIDYLGTVRARVGYLLSPTLIIIGTGGLAYGETNSTVAVNQSYGNPGIIKEISPSWGTTGNYSNTRIGWTAGANLEWMFHANWSTKLEYLYYDLGTVNYSAGNLVDPITVPFTPQNFFTNSVNATTHFDGQIIRVGVNYHFT